jgi:hypothetical protein
VEQKNGAVIRQFVGYDRFEGEPAYRQLVELYRALRLYVNFFQPSMKLKAKHRDGASVRRTYDTAQTPFERLCRSGALPDDVRARLEAIFTALDPVRLLQQIGRLQDAPWRHAVVGTPSTPMAAAADMPTPLSFSVAGCGMGDGDTETPSQPSAAAAAAIPIVRQKRTYHRKQPQLPRWWRTRVDPFAEVWTEIEQWLEAQPERTAKSIFVELQQRYPGQFPDGQLRTLQRRIARWRATMITTFDEHWLEEEVLAGAILPRPLQATARALRESEQRSVNAVLRTAHAPALRCPSC